MSAALKTNASCDALLKATVEAMEEGDFARAFSLLDRIRPTADSAGHLRRLRGIVCFRHAVALTMAGRFRDALFRAREADHLEPGRPEIKKLLDELAGVQAEKRRLEQLQRSVATLLADKASLFASGAAGESSPSRRSHRLKVAGHLADAMREAAEGKWESAQDHLDAALRLAPT